MNAIPPFLAPEYRPPAPALPVRARRVQGGMTAEEGLSAAAAAALIRQVAETRDRAAFAALFNHFAPRVKAYLRRLGAAEQQAEDLAQEAMLLVWRKAERFDAGRAAASTWVFTIARNLRIDAIRRDPKGRMLSSDEVPDQEDDGPGAETELLVRERDSRLHEALDALPPEQARLVRLAFLDDTPHSQIERLVGIPLGTVKSRLRAAMQRLRAAMEELR